MYLDGQYHIFGNSIYQKLRRNKVNAGSEKAKYYLKETNLF